MYDWLYKGERYEGIYIYTLFQIKAHKFKQQTTFRFLIGNIWSATVAAICLDCLVTVCGKDTCVGYCILPGAVLFGTV